MNTSCHPERSEGPGRGNGTMYVFRTARPSRSLATLGMTLLVACSFFSKTKSQIYTLDRVPGQVTNVLGTPIAINSIELPAGFDRKEIVVRKANNQLDVRGTEQWPATLSDVVLHTLAFD